MFTAAKKVSQVAAHTGIAFSLMYVMTGSVVFGGLAAVLEPVVNVLLLPFHERAWHQLRARAVEARARYAALAGEKISQTLMHAAVAFLMLWWATGSMALGGLAAVLEPILNVIALPYHDRLWDRFEARVALRPAPAGAAFSS
ncbi:hypothetical protein ASC94_05290 [Massilia sp. Root418]|uniref:DUF2061 domain-containing protein n=1 Tax=Massilia sp. Root418 TaxID=1736532 RepID=UPI0006FC6259|nr:DUF2061 domain-containing protein [Massilia sp. Root418]KQX01988.1 hypothetical protein ASC94_05290 [Massilia sp. Root418]